MLKKDDQVDDIIKGNGKGKNSVKYSAYKQNGDSESMSFEARSTIQQEKGVKGPNNVIEHKNTGLNKSRRGKSRPEKVSKEGSNINDTPRQKTKRNDIQPSIKTFVNKEGSSKRPIQESSSPGDEVKKGLELKNQNIDK